MMNIDNLRNDTPSCKKIIHFNNAGASLMPTPVSKILHDYLSLEEEIGGYEAAELKSKELSSFYDTFAQLLNCKSNEIAYLENATRAWDMAFYSIPLALGDKIVISQAEYGSSMIAYLHRAKTLGFEIITVPSDNSGQIDLNYLENVLDDRVKLISICHIPTGSGLVNPVKEVGKIANRRGILYLLDACQSVGQLPVDVEEIGCDFLSGTGRKYLRGPRGTGFLYARHATTRNIVPAFLDQHAAELISDQEFIVRDDAKRFENWEQNVTGKLDLAKAARYAMDIGLGLIQERVFSLASKLRARLSKIDGVTCTDIGKEKCGIVTFTVAGQSISDLRNDLLKRKINISISRGSGSLVLFQTLGLTEVLRASVHYFNTEEEIEMFADALDMVRRSAHPISKTV